MGARGGGEGVGVGGDAAGADGEEVLRGVLPQLRAFVLRVARRHDLHMLLHMAGGAGLQGEEGDLAVVGALPVAAGKVELRIPVVLLPSGPVRTRINSLL